MSKITKSSFFLIVFLVSLVWFSITLAILMLHEDMSSKRFIRENLAIEKGLESKDHFQKVHMKNEDSNIKQEKNVKDIADSYVNNSTRLGVYKHGKKQNVFKNQIHNPPVVIENPQIGNKPNRSSKSKQNIGQQNEIKNKSTSGKKQVLREHLLPRKENIEYKDSKKNIAQNVVELNDPNNKVSELERLKHLDAIAAPNAPGEMGLAVKINVSALPPDQKKLYDDLYRLHSFSQYTSDKISLHRRVADIRNQDCKAKTYRKDLPNTSVIMCFHNEAWSVLLRSVHSILDRSPPHLVHEIILVDDFSDMEHLKKPLDDYLSTLKKVKLLRTKKRQGLVRARLLGYSISTGDTLTFLDSHIECFPGWLEPLLDRVAANSTIAVAPLIPMINSITFSTQRTESSIRSVGGFDLEKVSFNWAGLPKNLKNQSPADPVKSPTIAGGLFTISRDFFTRIGTYDEGMDIWGGENLEISFRIWMCGGSLEIHPCSAVGHIYRVTSPYKWGKSFFEILRHNSVRVAEVWMDDYKYFYYEKLNFNLGNFGDVSARKELRKKLNCQSFDWYVKNVFPWLLIPEKNIYSGEIKNDLHSTVCIDSMNSPTKRQYAAGQLCHGQAGNQNFGMLASGKIKQNELCLDYIAETDKLQFGSCSIKRKQKWEYTKDKQLNLKDQDICIELLSDGQLSLRKCKIAPEQQWTWSRKYVNQN